MMGGWIQAIEGRVHIIHQELYAARELVIRMVKNLDAISSPCFEMLAKLYREDFPYASLADHADLVARFIGLGVASHEPPVSMVTGAFSKLRTQIQHIAKSIAGLEDKKVRWPEHLDPHLSGLAYGSLVVGMRVPRPGEVDSQGQLVLEGVTDGLYAAVRDAVRSLPVIPRLIYDKGVSEEVYSLFPDPAVRDTLMLAVHKLVPSNMSKGITDSFLGRSGEKEITPPSFTKKSWEILRKSLKEPVGNAPAGKTPSRVLCRRLTWMPYALRSGERGISAESAASTTSDTKSRRARFWTAPSESAVATRRLLMNSPGL